MWRPALVVRIVVVLAAVLAGCRSASSGQRGEGGAAGGSTGADGAIGDADPTTTQGFCRDLYTDIADLLARCDGYSPAELERLFSDPLFCARFEASIAAHRTAFDPTNARACLSEIAAQLTCDGVSPNSQPTSACDGVLTPKVPVGGMCKSFSVNYVAVECVDGSYCQQGPNSSCDGTCTARTPMGAACDPLSNDPCVAGAACDFKTKTCAPPPTPGVVNATCDDFTPCARGLFCDSGADGGTTGTCQTKRTSGPCVTGLECVPAERCMGATGAKSCAPSKLAGASCTPGLGECDLFSYCGPANKCTDGPAAVGQPCGLQPSGEGIPCDTGAYCDAGTCRAMKQAGAPCTGNVLECGGNNGRCDATTHVCVACPY